SRKTRTALRRRGDPVDQYSARFASARFRISERSSKDQAIRRGTFRLRRYSCNHVANRSRHFRLHLGRTPRGCAESAALVAVETFARFSLALGSGRQPLVPERTDIPSAEIR